MAGELHIRDFFGYNLATFPNGLMVDDCIVLLVSILVFYLKICPSRVATKNKILLGDYQRFPFFFLLLHGVC